MKYFATAERKFSEAMKKLIPEGFSGKRFLLAVSGGSDSMVLLELFRQFQLKYEVAHCNYGLRGKESDDDEILVRKKAAESDIVCHVKKFNLDVVPDASIQLQARELRYGWFESLCQERTLDYIVTAHHLNDNAETILFNFIRGTGIRGLSGIPEKAEKIIRPMLDLTKEEIMQYVQLRGIEYRDDRSNFTTKYKRNKIRLELLPKIAEINTNFIKTISDHIHEYSDLQDLLQERTENFRKVSCHWDNDCLIIGKNDIVSKPGKFNILYNILEEFGFSRQQVSFLLDTGLHRTGTKIETPTHELYLHGESWVVAPILPDFDEITITTLPSVITTTFGTFRFSEIENAEATVNKNELIIRHDIDSQPLTIRTRRDGDRFAPEGMQGKRQKLKDYFINEKMSVAAKDRQLLLCLGAEILWVVGRRRSHRKLDGVNAGKCIRVEYL